MATFTNEACATGGVNPTDPLLFTCEVNGVVLLRLVLPTGDQEIVSVGDTAADLSLPTGYTAVSLDITEIDGSRRNFHLTIFIANASLLGGGEIICDNTTSRKAVKAGCPIGKLFSPSPLPSFHLRLCISILQLHMSNNLMFIDREIYMSGTKYIVLQVININ